MQKHFIIYFSLLLILSSSLLISGMQEKGSAVNSNKPDAVNLQEEDRDDEVLLQEGEKLLNRLSELGFTRTIENPQSPRTKKANEVICYLNQYKFSINADEQTSEKINPDLYLSSAQAGIFELQILERDLKTKK